MKKNFRCLIFLMTFALLLTGFFGCSTRGDVEISPTSTPQTSEKPSESPKLDENDAATSESPDTGLPIVTEPMTLRAWWPFQFTNYIADFSKTEGILEIEKRTGIELDMVIPASGQNMISYQLMMSSGDYTDIIVNEPGYTGGGDKAIEDGVYLKLNDMLPRYAPNYSYYLDNYPDYKKSVLTDSGNIFAMYGISVTAPNWEPALETPGGGLVVRKDWLEKLDLEVPTTLDDMYGVLNAFKDNDLCENPLLLEKSGVFPLGDIVTAFGVAYSPYSGLEFYQVDGDVKYAFLEPGFKDYLSLMTKWYKEGLIDQNFGSRTEPDWPNSLLAKDVGGISSIGYGYAGDALYGQTKQTTNPDFYLQAITQPVLNEGDTTHFGFKAQLAQSRTVITTACEAPDIAMRYLDFFYTPEGVLLTTYGIEGKSYNFDESGNPIFTDMILKSTDIPPAFAVIQYSSFGAPGLKDISYVRQFTSESAMASKDVWVKNNADWAMPLNLTMTAEEGSDYSTIMGDVNTYVTEMTVKFIMGLEALSEYDRFAEQLIRMDVERAIEIKQDALDRYNSR